jgi:hypothetical protein
MFESYGPRLSGHMTHSYRFIGTEAVAQMEGAAGRMHLDPNASCTSAPAASVLSRVCGYRRPNLLGQGWKLYPAAS